jgi:hypothetical protein
MRMRAWRPHAVLKNSPANHMARQVGGLHGLHAPALSRMVPDGPLSTGGIRCGARSRHRASVFEMNQPGLRDETGADLLAL